MIMYLPRKTLYGVDPIRFFNPMILLTEYYVLDDIIVSDSIKSISTISSWLKQQTFFSV